MISNIMKGNIHPVAALSKHLQGWGNFLSQGSLLLEWGSCLHSLGQASRQEVDQLTSDLSAGTGWIDSQRVLAPPPSSRGSEMPQLGLWR